MPTKQLGRPKLSWARRTSFSFLLPTKNNCNMKHHQIMTWQPHEAAAEVSKIIAMHQIGPCLDRRQDGDEGSLDNTLAHVSTLIDATHSSKAAACQVGPRQRSWRGPIVVAGCGSCCAAPSSRGTGTSALGP